MKTQFRTLSLTIAAILMIAATGWAQQPNSSNDQQMQNMQGMQMKGGQMQPGQKMSKNSMMQSCHKHMESMMTSNAQTMKDIEAAKESNDPAKMRVALDEAEKALSPMNEHMKGCMMTMNMMQNMHGKGMSNMQRNGQKGTPQD